MKMYITGDLEHGLPAFHVFAFCTSVTVHLLALWKKNGTRREGQAQPQYCKQHPNMQYLTRPKDKNKPRAAPFAREMTAIGEPSEETKGGREAKKTGNFDHQLIRSGSCIMNGVEEARLARRTIGRRGARRARKDE